METKYEVQRKKVFKTKEIAHIWAQQKLSRGRNPQGNVFFEGPSIWSYGRHFETARFMTPEIVFVTTRSYSVTTSHHVWEARRAVSDKTVFMVPSFTDHNENAQYLLKELVDNLASISRMRKDSEWALERYAENAVRAREYVRLFADNIDTVTAEAISGIYQKRANPFTPEVVAALKKRAAADRERSKAIRLAHEKRDAERRAEQEKDYDAWKSGEDVTGYFGDFPVALRLKDNVIETTRGASVPVIEAKKFWHTLKAGTAVEGMRLGHYTVTGVVGTDLIVGCHVIPLKEIAKMASVLGLQSEAK